MEVAAAKALGAGIAVIALFGVGLGIGNIFSSLITSVARNPAARDAESHGDDEGEQSAEQAELAGVHQMDPHVVAGSVRSQREAGAGRQQ